MMDVDGGGTVSLRELNRVLMGEVIRFVSADFDHPDTGLVFGLDEENCVVIVTIEERSAASAVPFLIERMRLHAINEKLIKPHNKKSLTFLYEELLRINDDALTLSFDEPILIINKFCCALDIEVDDDVYSITLPTGAVYSPEIFTGKIHEAFRQVNPLLNEIKVEFNIHRRQITFRSETLTFRLLFSTGPNCRRSCRYSFGFSAEDTTYQHVHVGQPMLMNLNLGITQGQMEVLMAELFAQYDRDGSGEFEFEEFRDFYIRYLDSEESIERLRKYAKHRFRDVEREKFVLRQQHERKLKAERRKYLKIKNHDLVADQKKRYFEDSYVDHYGIRRRKYHHRTIQSQPLPPPVVVPEAPSEVPSDVPSPAVVPSSSSADYVEEVALHEDENAADVPIDNVQSTTDNMIAVDTAPPPNTVSVSAPTSPVPSPTAMIVRRNKKLKRIAEMKKHGIPKHKTVSRSAAASSSNVVYNRTELMELQYRIKKHVLSTFAQLKKSSPGVSPLERLTALSHCFQEILPCPAVTVSQGVLDDRLSPSNNVVDVQVLPASKVHPAMMNYYCLKEDHSGRSQEELFNSSVLHPAFFTADYIRQSSRHSYVALSLARLLKSDRSVGVQYRAEKGITKRYHIIPPEDIPPLRHGRKQPTHDMNRKKISYAHINDGGRKRVSFLDMEVNALNKPKGQSVLARLTIQSIRLEDLRAGIHLQYPSPFVSMQCGEGKFVTEIYSLAGMTNTYQLTG
eukprot:scaffold8581_cov181-Ochromonas_danica.AAC.3